MEGKKAEGGTAMNYKLITTLAVLGLVVLFIVQNVAVVEVSLLVFLHVQVTPALHCARPGNPDRVADEELFRAQEVRSALPGSCLASR